MEWWPWLVVALASYLLGSIPSGLWIGKLFFGVDIRDYGSHRTGATNVLRTVGKGAAAGAVTLDVLKAVLAVELARWLLPTEPWAHVLAAMAVTIGHNWPVFVGFRGGRGVLVSLTSTGVLYWPVLVILLVVGLAIIWRTRYVSLASVVGAALAPLLFLGFHFLTPDDVPWPYVIYAFVGGALIIVSHKDNIERLRDGTESKLGQRVERSPEAA
jgi:glycerol-3-phosphate acyltransferase PlsY